MNDIVFKSTASVVVDNLESLKKICAHVADELRLKVDGPKARERSRSLFDAHLSPGEGMSQSRSVHFSFDNKNCQLIVEFHSTKEGTKCGTVYGLKDYNNEIIKRIKITVKDWIIDGALPR